MPTDGSINDQASDASKSALAVEPTTTAVIKPVEVRLVKIELDICGQVTAKACTVWVKKGSITLNDEQMILSDDSKLNDLIINTCRQY